MRIAFDLDHTLIPSSDEFTTEPKFIWPYLLGAEQLRLGTRTLFCSLKNEGHTIWIYTTSLRKRRSIFKTFLSYGIVLDGIVNSQTHCKTLGAKAGSFSKYPPAFKIDLLVDDELGVALEGKRGCFEVLLVGPSDRGWDKNVLDFVRRTG